MNNNGASEKVINFKLLYYDQSIEAGFMEFDCFVILMRVKGQNEMLRLNAHKKLNGGYFMYGRA